jgi:hypothetical protein
MRRLHSVLLTAGAAIALPLSVCGHGSEFLLAKVQLMKDASLLVEVTADYGENPMLSSEEEARAALKDTLNVRVGDQSHPLNEVVPVRFERRSQQDPSAPLPPDPLAEGKSHQLLTASWQWKPSADAIAFDIPKESTNTLIMWVMDEQQPTAKPKWQMLIAGDVSPPITLPRSPWPADGFTVVLVSCLLSAGVIRVLMHRRNSRG